MNKLIKKLKEIVFEILFKIIISFIVVLIITAIILCVISIHNMEINRISEILLYVPFILMSIIIVEQIKNEIEVELEERCALKKALTKQKKKI